MVAKLSPVDPSIKFELAELRVQSVGMSGKFWAAIVGAALVGSIIGFAIMTLALYLTPL